MADQQITPPAGYQLDQSVMPPSGYTLDPVFHAEGTATAPRSFGSTLLHAPGDILQGIGSGVVSTGLGAYNLVRRIPGAASVLPAPGATFQAAAQPPDSLAGKAGKFLEQGAEFLVPMGEVAKAVEGLPLAARIAAEALTAGGTAGVQTGGDVPAMAETAATTGLLGGLGAAVPGATRAVLRAVVPRLEAAGIPLSANAEALARKFNIPLTSGMRTGSPAIQSAEGILGNTVAPDLYRPAIENAQTGINAGAKDLSGGFATDKFSAGDNTIKTMMGQAKDYTDQAQTEYANLAKHEADPANARDVQLGTKPNPSADPTQPDQIPATESMGLPVDMRPSKQALQPLADEMARHMTGLQQRADPGLAAIKNILTRPDFLPASTAEGDLSYLKEIMRGPASGQAKRLAGAAIDSLSGQVETAVAQAGPDALASLHDARGAWQARSQILDQVKGLTNDETGSTGQVLLANKLLQPSDASFPALQKVLAVAPDAGNDLGKAYLTERVFKGTAAGEDVNPRQAANLWNQIGPRTKAALYTPDQITNIDDFMTLAKRVGENPALAKGGVLNTLVKVGAFIAHPIGGPASFVLGRNVAKVLYSPEGAQALRTALAAPGSAEASKAMLVVKSLMDESETAGK